ncbi:glycosyltransferase [Ornithinimicrobium flavum]|uniref:glycosyltransferase n=1 Tax=Ornithinimicrobium flavum TaxID=1288636 RepID=UPI00106F2FE3|nr:glycosyltransferase [Ornithinimicrobium flavum]
MIGYYVHHQGQGHRRRATAVARELRVPVTGLGTGDAPQGWPGEWLSLAPDDDPEVKDPAFADVTAGDILHWAPRHHPGLLERNRQIVGWLSQERPSLVVVDVSVEVTLLARICGIPVVVGAMPGDRTDPVHCLAYDVAEALLAPWPYAAHSDAGWRADWWEKTWHVGGISALAGTGAEPPPPAEPDEDPGATRRVLVLWGNGGDPLSQDDLDQAREHTPGWEWTVRGGGFPPAEDLAAELAAADVVVCHAGQGSVADVAWARRPAVVLAQPRPFDEQDATVRALERLGLAATALGWPQARRWPALLERALETGGHGWSAWGGDGAGRAALLIRQLAARVGRTS